jgi:type IV secretory pathway VirB10-like protein
MHSNRNPRGFLSSVAPLSALRRTRVWACGLALLACIVLVSGAAQSGQQQQQQPSATPDKPSVTSEASQPPDADDEAKPDEPKPDEAKPPEPQPAPQAAPTPGAEHKRQISDDSAKLLTLAMALKAEVDKTNKDMLSLDVIRKADEIEKLAHNVRDKMKVSVGGS